MSASRPPAVIEWMRLNKRTSGACSVERDSREEISVSINFRETFRIVNFCEGRMREISPKVGSVTIIPPESRYTQTLTGVASGLVFVLPWSSMADWIWHETEVAPEQVQLRLSIGIVDDVLARALLTLAAGDSSARGEATHAVLGRLFRFHSNRADAKRVKRAVGGLMPSTLKKFVDSVETRIGSNISVKEMAGSFDYTEAHFIRQFKATTGVTTYRYIIERRLEKAMEALLTQEAKIADIAVQTGFTQASHLSRMFRRRFGVTADYFCRSIFPPPLIGTDLKV